MGMTAFGLRYKAAKQELSTCAKVVIIHRTVHAQHIASRREFSTLLVSYRSGCARAASEPFLEGRTPPRT